MDYGPWTTDSELSILRRMSEDWTEHVGRAWRESAPYWAKHGELVRTLFAPITETLVEESEFVDGQRVLDVAGGPGEPALTIARLVGADGLVVHTDVVPYMVAAARHEARERGATSLRSAVASGDALPFQADAFDRVVCRLGLPFFPNATGGVAEMLRVTRPDGRVAIAVWGSRPRNPFFDIPSALAAKYAPSPDPPGAPDAWRFAEPGLVATMLAKAGAGATRERVVSFDMTASIGFDEFWETRVELSDTLRGRTAALSVDEMLALRAEMRDATRDFFASGSMCFPAEALVVTAFRADSPS